MAYSVALVEQGSLVGSLRPDHTPTTGVCPSDKLAPTRWARVRVTTDTTTYSTGGLALNVLAVLTGWTGIARWYSNRVKWSSTTYYADLVVPNHGTAGSRLVKILNASTNAEHAASASTASTFDMWVSGW